MRASLLLVAAIALSPIVAGAQAAPAPDSVQRTHTVKKKDTLWDLANAYLGDPFRWPAIYQINRDVVEDPHWIYPGEVLKIPGNVPAAEIAETPQAEAAPQEKPAQRTPEPVVEIKPADEPPPANDASIFVQSGQRHAPEQPQRIIPAIQPPEHAVRLGEFLAAPFVDQEGGPRGPGRLIERADLSGIPELSPQEIFQLYDRVLVSPPVGNVAAEGERFISFAFGPMLPKIGQVIIPTGIVQITRAPRRGEAAIAKVVKVFADMRADQKLMPYDSSALATPPRAQSVTDGRWASVQWVQGEPVLPSVQTYAVLNISSKDGVKLGDEFELFRERIPPQDAGQLAKPEISIGRAQVVRVTPFGATVVIKSQEQPAIKKGTMARISAKMP